MAFLFNLTKSLTMKTSIKYLIIFAISHLALAGQTAFASLSVDMVLPTQQIHVGENFSVEVVVNNLFDGTDATDELLAFGFNTVYTGNFNFLDSIINPLFQNDSSLFGLSDAGSAFPGIANTIDSQTLTLTTLNFQALEVGSVGIGIYANQLDFNQGLIFLNQNPIDFDSSINLTVTAVPVPAALSLFLSAISLFGFAGSRGKKS